MDNSDNLRSADQATHTPSLHTVVIGDEPASWAAAGFTVDGLSGDEVMLGPIRVKLVGGDQRGVVAWEFTDLNDVESIDGLNSLVRTHHGRPPGAHPNGVTGMDHVVIMSPDVERTVTALQTAGFEPRRRRVIETATPPFQQVFFWAGPTILELGGPLEPTSSKPSNIWGLALVTDDIDASTTTLGELSSTPKTAVQPGRRIATLRTKELDISITIALMTPHV